LPGRGGTVHALAGPALVARIRSARHRASPMRKLTWTSGAYPVMSGENVLGSIRRSGFTNTYPTLRALIAAAMRFTVATRYAV
jgi:hypothetical protein